jgi:hypothetical protein
MLPVPLDSVILMLKILSDEDVTAVLLDCLEPRMPRSIDHSRAYLVHTLSTRLMIAARLQHLGSSSRRLGSVTRKSWHCFCYHAFLLDTCIDACINSLYARPLVSCAVGSLIGLGIQFGVAAGSNQMAAILSFPKTPWL